MIEFQSTPLRDLGEWVGGNTPSKAMPRYWERGTIPWVSPKDMKVQEITSSEDQIAKAALKEGRASLLPEGAVLVVTRSGILSHTLPVATTRLPVTINQDLKALIPRSGVLPTYVAYALRCAARRILDACSKHGTTVASIDTNALLDFRIPLTNLQGQQATVAEIEKQFSRLDEAVASLERAKANLARYKAAILKAAVEGRLVPTEASLSRLSGSPFENGDTLLTNVLQERPKHWPGRYKPPVVADPSVKPKTLASGWTVVALDSLLREPLRNGHSAKATNDPRGLRAFTLSAVTEGDFSVHNTKRTVADAAKVARLWAEPGDLFIEMSNTPELVGTARLYEGPRDFAFFPDLVIRARISSAILVRYLEITLQADSGRQYFKARAQGISGSMPKIDQAVIERFPIPLPPLAEQRRIVAEVDRLMSLARATPRPSSTPPSQAPPASANPSSLAPSPVPPHEHIRGTNNQSEPATRYGARASGGTYARVQTRLRQDGA